MLLVVDAVCVGLQGDAGSATGSPCLIPGQKCPSTLAAGVDGAWQ